MKTVIITVIAALAMASAAYAGSADSIVATEGHAGAEVCFSRVAWSANDANRPCDVLYTPQEDGSTAIELGTLGRTIATCVVPNPQEEGARFVVVCHKR